MPACCSDPLTGPAHVNTVLLHSARDDPGRMGLTCSTALYTPEPQLRAASRQSRGGKEAEEYALRLCVELHEQRPKDAPFKRHARWEGGVLDDAYRWEHRPRWFQSQAPQLSVALLELAAVLYRKPHQLVAKPPAQHPTGSHRQRDFLHQTKLPRRRAGVVTSEYAKTFYLGTKLMTPEKARAVWAIYVWCRRTDELVDGPNASRITPEV